MHHTGSWGGRRRWALTVLLATVAVGTLLAPGAAAQPTPDDAGAPRRLVLVELAVPVDVTLDVPFGSPGAVAAADAGQVAAQRARLAGVQDELLGRLPGDVDVAHRYGSLAAVSLSVTPEQLAALEDDPMVASVSEVGFGRPSVMVDDEPIGAAAARRGGFTGGGRTVAVLDTGVDVGHPALADAVVGGACFATGDGSAPGGTCPNGETRQSGPNAAVPCDLAACFHGTHVAAIAAGRPPVPGVAAGASLFPVQVFSEFGADTCGGGSRCVLSRFDDQIAALEDLYDRRRAGTLDLVAVNVSINGGPASSGACEREPAAPGYVRLYHAAVENLRSVGVPVVVSAGNDGDPRNAVFPACLSNVVAVGASTGAARDERVASFSNLAPTTTLVAPGVDITSATPRTGDGGAPTRVSSGTSMAAPMVAGAVAVVTAARSDLTGPAAVDLLVRTGGVVRDTRLSPAREVRRLDVAAALSASVLPPAPGEVAARGGRGQATVRWSPSVVRAPGRAAEAYVVTDLATGEQRTTDAATTTVTWTGLAAGAHRFSVTARNAVGAGPSSAPSAPADVTDVAAPGPPLAVTIEVHRVGPSPALTVRWDAPDDDGGLEVEGYDVELAPAPPGAPATRAVSANARSLRIDGLVGGTRYSATVRARNAAGPGAPARAAATTAPQVLPGTVDAPSGDPARFVPVAPTRLLDTREASGGAAPVPADGEVVVDVAGGLGVDAGSLTAVALTVTLVDAAAPGYVTAWPSGLDRPGTSSLNAEAAGQTIANLVVVPVGADGRVRLYSQSGGHLVADAAGYWEAAGTGSRSGRFQPVSPARLLDTRLGGAARPGADAVVDVAVTGQGGVPADGVAAVALTVTATDAAGPGYVTAWPAGEERPLASNLNLERAGQTVPDLVVVPVGANGAVSLYTQTGAHLVVDVAGWFTDASGPTSGAGLLVPVAPTRLLDTRAGAGPLGADAVTAVPLEGRAPLPSSGVAGVVGNLTGTEAQAPGYVTVWPAGELRPEASNLNLGHAGQTVANGFMARLGASDPGGRGVALYAQAGAHLVLDVTGWFTA